MQTPNNNRRSSIYIDSRGKESLKRLADFLEANRDALPRFSDGTLNRTAILRAAGLNRQFASRCKAAVSLVATYGVLKPITLRPRRPLLDEHSLTTLGSNFLGVGRTRSGQERGTTNIGQSSDPTYAWVSKRCLTAGSTTSPIERWREFAEEYTKHISAVGVGSYNHRIAAIRLFLEFYIWKNRFFEPERFLTLPRKAALPPLVGRKGEAPFRQSAASQQFVNYVHEFLAWIIDEKFSSNEDGMVVSFPGYRIPIERIEKRHSMSARTESVRSALQFKYIRELRAMLATGNDFRDWKWAQNASGVRSGNYSGDWFEVKEDQIDKSDPDCVWRQRVIPVRNYQLAVPDSKRPPNIIIAHRNIFEIWSPVSAVALLLKLELPLRTYQVRMLDSGETDRYRVEIDPDEEKAFLSHQGAESAASVFEGHPLFKWVENKKRTNLLSGLLKPDLDRVSDSQGVFLKCHDRAVGSYVGFFVNTNKTADIDKDWHHRGYRIPWQHHSLHRWLIKLRNWQEKFNPIIKPTLWSELSGRHFGHEKTAAFLSEAAPTCFLFRDRAAKGGINNSETSKPISDSKLNTLWGKMLLTLEKSETAATPSSDGNPSIRLVKSYNHRNSSIITFYPLHALRVSLITALADGGMALELIMQLAGHSRLVMTIYYRKISVFAIGDAIRNANKHLTKNADQMVVTALLSKPYEDLPNFIAVDDEGMRLAVPRNPRDRNAAGFERQLGGWCLMGGNTTPHPLDYQIGGCHNGGEPIRNSVDKSSRIHAAIRPKACIEGKCRWFVSRPEYILEIKARMDLLATNLGLAQRQFESAAKTLEDLRREKFRAAQSDIPFSKTEELDLANRIHERTAAEVNYIVQALTNGARLADRVLAVALLPEKGKPNKTATQFVAQGSSDDMRQVFGQIDASLLELSGFPVDSEIFSEKEGAKPGTPKWGFESVSPLHQLTSVAMNAEAFPELLFDSFGAILERTQHLEDALKRKGFGFAFTKLTPEDQLRICNRITRELAAPLNGNLDAAIGILLQDSPLPDAMVKALQNEVATGAYSPTTLSRFIAGQQT